VFIERLITMYMSVQNVLLSNFYIVLSCVFRLRGRFYIRMSCLFLINSSSLRRWLFIFSTIYIMQWIIRLCVAIIVLLFFRSFIAPGCTCWTFLWSMCWYYIFFWALLRTEDCSGKTKDNGECAHCNIDRVCVW